MLTGLAARPPGGRVLWLAGVVLAGCAARMPRVTPGPLAGGLGPFLASHPLAAGQAIRADEVGRTAGASYHLVQACGSERPHRHATHDLTAVVLQGRGALVQESGRTPMAPGDAAVVPRGTTHWFAPDAGTCAAALVVFTPPLDAPDVVPVGSIDSPAGGR